MTRDEVFSVVQGVFRDIFDEDELVISNTTTSAEIEEWDSLNHINLISVIEKELEIKFYLGELMGLKNVGTMVDLIIEKRKSA